MKYCCVKRLFKGYIDTVCGLIQLKNRGVKQRALRLRVMTDYRNHPNNVCSGCALSQPYRNVLAYRLAL